MIREVKFESQDRRIKPVSYTHLDVYKRQRLSSSIEISSQALAGEEISFIAMLNSSL